MRPSLRPPWPTQIQLLRWHPRIPQSIPRRIATTSATYAAPIDIPKLILAPGSKHHNSLPSFLEYAKRKNLATDKPTYIGTHYEYTTALSLLRLGFSLLRIGRKFDAGIDLIGHWVLAPLREPLPVIIQCKARNVSVNPCNVRELEGSFQGTPADWKNKDVLGLLITTNKATKGTIKAIGRSRWPLGFAMISKDGVIQQLVWNRAASERGLEGVGVTLRHTPRAHLADSGIMEEEDVNMSKAAKKFRNSGTQKDIQLTWMGTPIFPERETLDQDTLNLMRVIAPNAPEESADQDKLASIQFKNGKYRVAYAEPEPRGGMVVVPPKPRGRPKGSKNVSQRSTSSRTVARRGRLKAIKVTPATKLVERRSKPRGTITISAPEQVAKRGRPKGSKNKSKTVVDAG
jgi:hypothetical protein